MTPQIERWHFTEQEGPARLQKEITEKGISWIQLGDFFEEASLAPWAFFQRVWGGSTPMIERQPIRAVSGGRSFASSGVYTPPHTDSQLYQGVPPHLQLMLCIRQSAQGGASFFVDSWALLERLEREDKNLFQALFRIPRRIPFVFGDVFGSTVSCRGGSLIFTHAPFGKDPLFIRIQEELSKEEPYRCHAERGDLLVIHNHRLLHGREAFDDPKREFNRLLAWLPAALPAPERYLSLAKNVTSALASKTIREPEEIKRALGVTPPRSLEAERRLRAVLSMLRGVPPGAISAKENIPETELYRWRDEALSAAAAALQKLPARDEIERVLQKLLPL